MRNVVLANHQDVDISIELQVLEAVVQDVDRRVELMLGQPPGEIAVPGHENRGAP